MFRRGVVEAFRCEVVKLLSCLGVEFRCRVVQSFREAGGGSPSGAGFTPFFSGGLRGGVYPVILGEARVSRIPMFVNSIRDRKAQSSQRFLVVESFKSRR